MAYVPQRDPTEVIGRRISAYLIDLLLVLGIGIAIFAALKSNSYTSAPSDACQQLRDAGFSDSCVQVGSRVYTWTGGRVSLAFLLVALAGLANHVVLQGISGASVGKMILGLRVVNGQGQVCGVGRAFVRWLLLIFVDQLCFFIVGLITVLVTHPHRRVGDMVAGTYVVSTADVGRPVVPQAAMPPAYAYAGQPGWTPPAPGAPTWGATPPAWGAQPAPPGPEQPGWAAPPPPYQQPAPPPPPPPQYTPPPPAAPSSWGTPPPPDAPASPESPPEPDPAPEESKPGGESWWDKALDDEDNPEQ